MRRLLTYMMIASCAALSLTSCNKWLEATSSNQFPYEKMFDNKAGFYDAITGVYISLGSTSLYGKACTWYVNDNVAWPFVYSQTSVSYYMQRHIYTSSVCRTYFDGIWSAGYNTIANANMILRALEEKADLIPTEEERNLMKGEMLAVRAYVHFDLLRMFGTMSWDEEGASRKALPYVTEFNREPVPQQTYERTAQLLLDDIAQALTLLENDPVTGRQREDFEEAVNSDAFWSNRTGHLNYYAVEALAARVNFWIGRHKEAASYAADVIENALGKGLVSWINPEEQVVMDNYNARDWSFSCEHLFSLEVSSLSSWLISDYYSSITADFQTAESFITGVLFPSTDPVSGQIAGAEDVRGPAMQMRFVSTGYKSYKLYASDGYYARFRNRIPMVRISEMYYILSYCDILSGDNAGALSRLDEVRAHRGISQMLPAGADALAELEKECYREFLGEGQLMYWLKYLSVKESLNPEFSLTASDLVFPYPEEEIDYGRIQE